jgi:hypothetical protein
MLRSITAKQWTELKAYKSLHPFREVREDYRAASIVAMIYNMAGKMGKNPLPIREFLLPFGEDPEDRGQRNIDQMERMMKLIALAYSVDAKDA